MSEPAAGESRRQLDVPWPETGPESVRRDWMRALFRELGDPCDWFVFVPNPPPRTGSIEVPVAARRVTWGSRGIAFVADDRSTADELAVSVFDLLTETVCVLGCRGDVPHDDVIANLVESAFDETLQPQEPGVKTALFFGSGAILP